MVALTDNFIGHHLDLFAHFIVATAHEPLDRINRIFRVRDGLALGHLAHKPLASLGNSNNGRRSPSAFLVRDHDRLAALHHGDYRVGGPEVNSDYLAHW